MHCLDIYWPQKGVKQRCQRGGCRTRDVSHHGRNLELLLLFLAEEAMAVTGVPEAGFGVEGSALSILYFPFARAQLIPGGTPLSQSSAQLFAYRDEVNERPLSVSV